jgi:mannose-6-phosphate isomerase-like protein (cupin superfamily)
MMHVDRPEPAATVLACRDLPACIAFFESLGFRLDRIFPAYSPRSASMSGFGMHLCLERAERNCGGHLRLPGARGDTTAPNGTRIEFSRRRETPPFPRAMFVVSELADNARWIEGRAGMLYRDLIPGRQGGALIASHIRIAHGGPVPDYVHFHEVTAQIIYCVAGWVRVVYEDQGEPFVMRAGDCVLQPPRIRHRVLESGDGLEVIEVSSPAEHVTCVDHELALPTNAFRPERQFSGQRFVRHECLRAAWQGSEIEGISVSDTGIETATSGAISVRIVRAEAGARSGAFAPTDARRFWAVVRGTLRFALDSHVHTLHAGEACVLPGHTRVSLHEPGPDLELLEVSLASTQ